MEENINILTHVHLSIKVIIRNTFVVRFISLVCFLYSTISLVSISRIKGRYVVSLSNIYIYLPKSTGN